MNQTRPAPDLRAAQPRGCTNLLLRQLTRQVTQHYDVHMAAAGLKTTQYSLLSTVLQLGPARPVDLALALKMDPSTLTRNLKPLLAAGWVDLSAGPDARTRAVSITPAGRAKRSEAQRHWRLAQDGLNRILGLPQVVALHTLVQTSLALLAPAEAKVGDE